MPLFDRGEMGVFSPDEIPEHIKKSFDMLDGRLNNVSGNSDITPRQAEIMHDAALHVLENREQYSHYTQEQFDFIEKVVDTAGQQKAA